MKDQLAYPFLPRLESADLSTPTRLGRWQDNGRAVLSQIADAIVYGDDVSEKGVSAVPDPWARALMFRSALRPNSRHPLRDTIVDEWRGLLSLLALREYRGHDVSFHAVRLGDDAFSRSLRSLRPAPIELEPGVRYSWEDVLLIRFEGIPVGALSPATLVYTGADYAEALSGTALSLQQTGPKGAKTGRLGPPTDPEDIEFVAEWVESLQRRLNLAFNADPTTPAGRVTNDLNELLSDWLVDLKTQLGRPVGEYVDAQAVQMAEAPGAKVPDWDALDRYRSFFHLLCPLVADGEAARGPYSEISLRADPGRNHSDYDEIIVITPRLLRGNPRVWRSTKANQLGATPEEIIDRHFADASGTTLRGEELIVKNKQGEEWRALWVRPERFFLTDTLVRSPDEDSLLAEGERRLNEAREGRRYLLPFRRDVLDFFGPERVQSLLQPAFEPVENGVKFVFRIPVGDSEETVERVYRYKDAAPTEGTIVEHRLPIAELFPRFMGRVWRRYYLLQDRASGVYLEPVSYGSMPPKQQDHAATVDGAHLEARLTMLHGDDPFPDGLVAHLADPDAVRGRDEPIGLVLTPRDDARERVGEDVWHIGVDFGTSNTNVFWRQDGADRAQAWTFDFPAYLRPLTRGDGARREALLSTFLVPPATVELPIPTLLNLYARAERDDAMLDYSIYFGGQYALPDFVEAGLKWNVEDRKTDLFLESLTFLLMLDVVREGVAELRFFYSYPKAYSELMLETVMHEWSRVHDRLFVGEHRVVSLQQGSEARLRVNKPRPSDFHLEGRATGEYFASEYTVPTNETADRKDGAVCLDVGGGTTDVSVWFDNEIVLDASVLMAGDIIASFLMNSSRLRQNLFSPRALAALDDVVGHPKKFGARLNIILKDEEGAIRKDRLSLHVNKEEVMWLRQLLILEFGAIVYYSAWLLAAADEGVDERLLKRVAEGGIRFHWGGNAAKLINWLDLGDFRSDGLAAKILNAVLFQGLKDVGVRAPGLAQIQSPGHKSEVAGGLVVPDAASGPPRPRADAPLSAWDAPGGGAPAAEEPGLMGTSDFEMDELDDLNGDSMPGVASEGVVSGERVRLAASDGGGERIVEPGETITKADLFAGGRSLFESSSLEQLIRFVNIANTFGSKYGLVPVSMRVNLDGPTLKTLDRKLRQAFADMERLDGDARVLEPIFITEIKVLLKMLIAERGDRR